MRSHVKRKTKTSPAWQISCRSFAPFLGPLCNSCPTQPQNVSGCPGEVHLIQFDLARLESACTRYARATHATCHMLPLRSIMCQGLFAALVTSFAAGSFFCRPTAMAKKVPPQMGHSSSVPSSYCMLAVALCGAVVLCCMCCVVVIPAVLAAAGH